MDLENIMLSEVNHMEKFEKRDFNHTWDNYSISNNNEIKEKIQNSLCGILFQTRWPISSHTFEITNRKYTVHYTDDVLYSWIPEIYILLSTNTFN